MECNRDEALRAKKIAEQKFSLRDFIGAKKFTLKAQNLYPSDGIRQMIATLDVYLASEGKINGEKDLYAILNVKALADEEAVKQQYRKLALQLHPDKNKSVGAVGAFQLVSEAWSVLSDRHKKTMYDQKISVEVAQKRTSSPSKGSPASNNGFHQCANNAAAKARGPQDKSYGPSSAPTPPSDTNKKTVYDQKISVKGVQRRTSNSSKGPLASNKCFHQFTNIKATKARGPQNKSYSRSSAPPTPSVRNKKIIYDQKISVEGVQKRTSNPSKGPPARNNGFHQLADNEAAKEIGPQKKPSMPASASTPSHPEHQTFWTSCSGCYMQYEYQRMYLNKSLLCPKCKKPFLATELALPTGGLNAPKWSSKQQNNKYKNASASSGMGTNVKSSFSSTFQWAPFFWAAATTGANNPYSTVTQATNVHQAFDRAKRQRQEAQAATRREKALRRKYNASRNYGTSTNTGMYADKFVNNRVSIQRS